MTLVCHVSVFDVSCLTCSCRMTSYVDKPSATIMTAGQSTQFLILSAVGK